MGNTGIVDPVVPHLALDSSQFNLGKAIYMQYHRGKGNLRLPF
jgi:hypothetical protein